MTMLAEGDSELLTSLHEGLYEEPLWSGFLGRLRANTAADYVSLIFRRRDAPINEIVELFAGKTAPASLHQRYIEEMHRKDPVPYHDLEPGRLYALMDLVDLEDEAQRAYVEEFLAPSGANYIHVLRIAEPSGYSAWLTLCRTKSDFSGPALELVQSLTHHMSLALRSFAAIERGRIRQSVYTEVMKRLNFGCLTLDASGCVVEVDEYAEQLLNESSVLRRNAHGRLALASPQADGALRAALRDLGGRPNARARCVHISEDPYLDMLLVPMRQKVVAGNTTPVLAAYVHGDEYSSADLAEHLMDLFHLSRTEARLAVALSRGRTLAESAQDIGITEGTARNYSKRVFSKTGTRRQAELVRLILASVLALA